MFQDEIFNFRNSHCTFNTISVRDNFGVLTNTLLNRGRPDKGFGVFGIIVVHTKPTTSLAKKKKMQIGQ